MYSSLPSSRPLHLACEYSVTPFHIKPFSSVFAAIMTYFSYILTCYVSSFRPFAMYSVLYRAAFPCKWPIIITILLVAYANFTPSVLLPRSAPFSLPLDVCCMRGWRGRRRRAGREHMATAANMTLLAF